MTTELTLVAYILAIKTVNSGERTCYSVTNAITRIPTRTVSFFNRLMGGYYLYFTEKTTEPLVS